ncbi:MAG: hypothetical protein ACRDY1_09630 [Acidimicrobiales bacterium]
MTNRKHTNATSRPRSTTTRPRTGPASPPRQRSLSAPRGSGSRRRTTALVVASAVVLVVGVAVALVVTLGGGGTKRPAPAVVSPHGAAFSGPPGPEGIPLEEGTLLAPASSSAGGQTVNDIRCDTSEQVSYHVHTHLTVYVDGVLRPIPAGIGIVAPVAQQTADGPFYGATHCYYWLHVHAQDGVIHIESPTERGYTLGDFFAIWRQPLTGTRVGPVTGTLTVFLNGHRDDAAPGSIPLGSHEDIQIDVGSPVVPPQSIDWAHTGL